MVAFLDCLQQFKEEVQKGDSGFCLPYKYDFSFVLSSDKSKFNLNLINRMEKGFIEDTKTNIKYSIK
jgi:beclin 1